MKVGIITYHKSQNYGAQLQAFALVTAISKLGCEAEIIDCNSIGEGKIFEWHFNSLRAFLGSVRNNILKLLFGECKRIKRFHHFWMDEIKHSKPCLCEKQINEFVNSYDFVVTGSDQVWHPAICEGKTLFFLDLPIKSNQKIAYAPSFGVSEYTNEQVKLYMPLINDILHLSVRENAGAELIRKYIGREVPIVIDPTMLLTKQDWIQMARNTHKGEYLFYFTILDEPEGCDEMVRRIAQEKHLDIVRIGTVKDVLKRGFINARASGPREFLGLVKDAAFVVTSSFHGSVFSILFEKEFVIVLNNNNRNSRLETLAEKLNLSRYVVSDVHSFNINTYKPIDYKVVAKSLDKLRNSSINFIKNSLNI